MSEPVEAPLSTPQPSCAQCRSPMALDVAEPVVGLPGVLQLTFRCRTCGLADRIKPPLVRHSAPAAYYIAALLTS